ncbi:MAG: hypothetical protein AAFY60_19320, partial [Myxococcota bacterium]
MRAVSPDAASTEELEQLLKPTSGNPHSFTWRTIRARSRRTARRPSGREALPGRAQAHPEGLSPGDRHEESAMAESGTGRAGSTVGAL